MSLRTHLGGRASRCLPAALLALLAVACDKSHGYTPPEGSPAAPSDLVVLRPSSYQFDLSWTDNSTDEDRFIVWIDPSEVDPLEIEVPADTTSYSYTYAVTGATLYFRVCAENAFGRSHWSNQVTAVTPDPPPPSGGCVLLLEDPGLAPVAPDGPAAPDGFDVATGNIDGAPAVLARAHFAARGDDVLLAAGPEWYGVQVRGRMLREPDLVRYELDFGVQSSPLPPGTTGESCICLHQAENGDLAAFYARHGLAGRPVVRSFALGLPFRFAVGQMFPTTITVDRVTATWTVEVAGVTVASDLPLDAVLTVPSLLVR